MYLFAIVCCHSLSVNTCKYWLVCLYTLDLSSRSPSTSPVVCQICGDSFGSLGLLIEHNRANHWVGQQLSFIFLNQYIFKRFSTYFWPFPLIVIISDPTCGCINCVNVYPCWAAIVEDVSVYRRCPNQNVTYAQKLSPLLINISIIWNSTTCPPEGIICADVASNLFH